MYTEDTNIDFKQVSVELKAFRQAIEQPLEKSLEQDKKLEKIWSDFECSGVGNAEADEMFPMEEINQGNYLDERIQKLNRQLETAVNSHDISDLHKQVKEKFRSFIKEINAKYQKDFNVFGNIITFQKAKIDEYFSGYGYYTEKKEWVPDNNFCFNEYKKDQLIDDLQNYAKQTLQVDIKSRIKGKCEKITRQNQLKIQKLKEIDANINEIESAIKRFSQKQNTTEDEQKFEVYFWLNKKIISLMEQIKKSPLKLNIKMNFNRRLQELNNKLKQKIDQIKLRERQLLQSVNRAANERASLNNIISSAEKVLKQYQKPLFWARVFKKKKTRHDRVNKLLSSLNIFKNQQTNDFVGLLKIVNDEIYSLIKADIGKYQEHRSESKYGKIIET
ncbi:MAG: hypothetical protein V3W20_08685, partial [Candidatus Neomarinimicrobiota bacterium]